MLPNIPSLPSFSPIQSSDACLALASLGEATTILTRWAEAGELLAEYRWVANDEADAWSKQRANYARIEREAADIAITLLLFCGRVGIDLPDAIRRKLEVNRRNYPAEKARGTSERPPRS